MAQTSQSPTLDPQLFQDVFNASPIGIAVENLEGQPLFVNPALCSMLGFSEKEIRSKHCVDFSPPEDAAKDWELFQQLRAGAIDHYQVEKRYFRRDGSLVWGSLSISLLNIRPSPLVIAMVEDITAKKKAEEAQFRHAAIVESSGDAIVSKTLDGMIVSWNSGAQRIYGYTEAEAIGKPINIVVPPELAEEENKILERLRAGERIENYETVRLAKAGKRLNVSLSLSPIKDASGAIVGLSGIARDISELKRQGQDLRTSEERLRLAQQAAHIGTFEWNIRTGVNTWTPELEAMYGLPPGGFGGTHAAFESLVYEEDRPILRELVESTVKMGQPTKGEWRVVWPDGSVHWLAAYWQVLMDESGKPLRVIGVNIDITERKQAEERLREYEKTVEGAEDMIGVIDREYRFLLANRQYLKMRNLTREQVVGHFVPEVLGRELFKIVKPKLDECFQGKVVKYEMKVSYPTVGERDLLLSYFPIEGVNGVDRAACILRDITDRKRAEQAVAEMTRKLIRAQEQERARIGRELHDDINQRLAMLSVELEQLHQNPSELPNRMQEIRKELRQISDDVQAMSHDLHSSKMEYLGVVSGMKSWCKQVAERHKFDIDFTSDLSSAMPLEIGLPLFRVLQEGVNNSIKHSGEKRVEVQLRDGSDQIHLLVRDSGVGFDLEGALRSKGLGLTSMRERVRLLNGTIAIESKPNDGTTIHVRVPVKHGSAEGLAP
jgi:PAS domain S-box-containing protein